MTPNYHTLEPPTFPGRFCMGELHLSDAGAKCACRPGGSSVAGTHNGHKDHGCSLPGATNLSLSTGVSLPRHASIA